MRSRTTRVVVSSPRLFAVLAAYVAINTVMHVALAMAKLLPKVYVGDWVQQRSRRQETRSIHPEARRGGA